MASNALFLQENVAYFQSSSLNLFGGKKFLGIYFFLSVFFVFVNYSSGMPETPVSYAQHV